MSAALLRPGSDPATLEVEEIFELISPDADWAAYEWKTTPRHTAGRLRRTEPVKYETLRVALADGAALTTLAKSHKVGINTLYAIIERDLGGLDAYHANMAQKFKRAANLGLDKVMELLPEEKDAAKAAIVTGIMVEKHALLAGLPTAITEVRHTVDPEVMERWNARLREARESEARPVEGRVIDEPAAVPADVTHEE